MRKELKIKNDVTMVITMDEFNKALDNSKNSGFFSLSSTDFDEIVKRMEKALENEKKSGFSMYKDEINRIGHYSLAHALFCCTVAYGSDLFPKQCVNYLLRMSETDMFLDNYGWLNMTSGKLDDIVVDMSDICNNLMPYFFNRYKEIAFDSFEGLYRSFEIIESLWKKYITPNETLRYEDIIGKYTDVFDNNRGLTLKYFNIPDELLNKVLPEYKTEYSTVYEDYRDYIEVKFIESITDMLCTPYQRELFESFSEIVNRILNIKEINDETEPYIFDLHDIFDDTVDNFIVVVGNLLMTVINSCKVTKSVSCIQDCIFGYLRILRYVSPKIKRRN